MSDIYVTWEEYNKKIEELAIKVYEDGCKFNQVICIAKGTSNKRLKISPTRSPPFAIHIT